MSPLARGTHFLFNKTVIFLKFEYLSWHSKTIIPLPREGSIKCPEPQTTMGSSKFELNRAVTIPQGWKAAMHNTACMLLGGVFKKISQIEKSKNIQKTFLGSG